MGRQPTANYGAGLDDAENQKIISQQSLRSKIPGLWINKYLNTDAKCNLRDFRNKYTFNTQDYGSEMFFVIVKMARTDTLAG